jgi:hypothetical protein
MFGSVIIKLIAAAKRKKQRFPICSRKFLFCVTIFFGVGNIFLIFVASKLKRIFTTLEGLYYAYGVTSLDVLSLREGEKVCGSEVIA